MLLNTTREPLDPPGLVITFYSYKGGTGRSMALANIAYLLAKDKNKTSDHGVLMMDWDLETPGLHSYFRDFCGASFTDAEDVDEALDAHPGLLDLFLELDEMIPQTDDPYKGQKEKEAKNTLDRIDFGRFILETSQPSLFLMKAGQFDEDYSHRVNTFNWENLYIRSPWLMRAMAEKLSERFQYILIDSRTGITDISNICAMLMPEKLVIVFTPNHQSLTGLKKLLEQAVDYREQSDDPRPLAAFPLPSRIDVSMPKLERRWRYGDDDAGIKGYQPLFENLFQRIYELKKCNLGPYFDEVKIQHVADYAYGEEIAAVTEESNGRLSLTRSYFSFIERLLGLTGPWEEDGRSAPITFDVFRSTPHSILQCE